MASIYDLKPKFQQLLRPSIEALYKCSVTPNQVTVAAFIGSVICGALCLQAVNNSAWLLVLPVWLFLRMALNAIDGVLAREYNLKSVLGAVLNEVGDVLSDTVLYLPLAIVNDVADWPVLLFVMGSILTEFCGVLGQALGAKRHYEGPMGKSDRAFFVGLTALVSFIFPGLLDFWAWIFSVAFILTIVTCVNRARGILKEIGHG